MKKLFLLLFTICSISVQSQSGWFVQPVGVYGFFSEIKMTDINTAFMVADSGRVLKTTNGGANWVTTVLPATNELFSLDFPSFNVGYCAGALGRIFKTTNAGVSWLPLPSPTVNGINSTKFINENTGFVAGGPESDGEIFKTTNGGVNWIEYGPGVTYPQIVTSFFVNENTGYAAGRNSLIMKTTNAGVNWTIQQTGLGNVSFFSVFFTNVNTGYLTTPFPGNIMKTTNGGTNWNSIYNNTDHFVVTMFFTSPDTGFVIGANTTHQTIVLKTTNSGSVWTTQLLDFDGHVNSINFINPSTGFIGGDQGRLYKTTNGGTTVGIEPISNHVPDKFLLHQNYPNPFNPVTNLEFEIAELKFVSLKVYNSNGSEVEVLVNQNLHPGMYRYSFDAAQLPSGVYFYILKSGGFMQTKRMVLLK